MSGIPEDATFEEPELACMLESLQKGKKGSGKGFRKGKKGCSKNESRDVLKAERAVVLRTTNKFDGSCRAIDLTEAGKISQLMERIKDVVVHSWLRWMNFSLAPVVSNVESWGILRRNPSEQGNNHKFRDFLQWHGLHQFLRCPSSKPILG